MNSPYLNDPRIALDVYLNSQLEEYKILPSDGKPATIVVQIPIWSSYGPVLSAEEALFSGTGITIECFKVDDW